MPLSASSPPVFLFFAALLGLVLGSFCNVCIWRYVSGESVVSPPSHCPECGHRLRPWELIPLLSWLLLRGRCSHCRQPISWRYPLVESLTALIAALLAWRFGPSPAFAALLLLSCAFLIASGIDALTFLLPDRYTLGTALPAFLCSVFLLGMPWLQSLAGGLIGAGVFWLVQAAFKRLRGVDGLGFGDVKLMLPLGFLTGPWLLPLTVLAAGLSALAFALPSAFLRGSDLRCLRVPFGPFLCLGAFISLLWGESLLLWWIRFLHG